MVKDHSSFGSKEHVSDSSDFYYFFISLEGYENKPLVVIVIKLKIDIWKWKSIHKCPCQLSVKQYISQTLKTAKS